MILRSLQRYIIHRHMPPRSPYDKTNFVENYVPRTHPRKPRQAKWDDPDYNWPPKLEKSTKLSNKALVSQLETEYLNSLKQNQRFEDIKSGDMVEVSTYQSISSQQLSVFTGLCIGTRRKNTINSSLNVITKIEGVEMERHIKLWSPMVKQVKIVEFGTGNFRARLNYFRGMTISKYQALKKGTKLRYKPTEIAKKEEREMRYKILKGELPEVNS
jgi:ribosomal protein L19